MAFSSKHANRWLRWLPVVALLIGIAGHATLMATVNADPQSGSAFAMFSSVDSDASRRITAFGLEGESQIAIEWPADLEADALAVRRAPTTHKADDLARRLQTLSWTVEQDRATVGGDTQFDWVQVTIRGLTADGHTLGQQVFASGTSS